MSVIEDALRRAEQQARTKRPQVPARPSTRPAPPRPPSRPVPTQPTVSKAPRQRLGLPLLVLMFAVTMFARLIYQQSHVGAMDTGLPPSGEVAATGSQAADSIQQVTEKQPHNPATLEVVSAGINEESFSNTGVIAPIAVDAVKPSQSTVPPRDRYQPAPQKTITQRNSAIVAPQSTTLLQRPNISDRFHVSGVMVGGGVRMVFINNTMLGIGDRIDDAIVRSINTRGATLELNGRMYDVQISSKPASQTHGGKRRS